MTFDSNENRKQFFSEVASEYDKYAAERLGYEAHLKVPAILLEVHNKRERTVLDLACGTGLDSLLFFESGFDVIGIDYSPGMTEVARLHPYKQLYCQALRKICRSQIDRSTLSLQSVFGNLSTTHRN